MSMSTVEETTLLAVSRPLPEDESPPKLGKDSCLWLFERNELWWLSPEWGVKAEFWQFNIKLEPSEPGPPGPGGINMGDRIRWWRWDGRPEVDGRPKDGLNVPKIGQKIKMSK